VKANVNPLSNLPDYFTVDNLKPVSYHRKDISRNEYGFIAHEVQEIYPDIVTGEKDGLGYQQLNYIALIPILVKEIQDLKKEVQLLKTNRA
ncbi:MAG: tail fiber domain-containing protein, partial [Alphaproteobacteria bacterium]|nr:tail fiber domain-containing protein [Alphaproteobacteria bacterium]